MSVEFSREARKPLAVKSLRAEIRVTRRIASATCLRCRKRVQAIELEGEICATCASILARAWDVAARWEAKPS